jgi:histone-lysine N-methyltransferase SETMAR
LIVHADNAKPHTAKSTIEYLQANAMKKAPHPPYSPDLAPSDFYLFGYVKGQLNGCSFTSGDELLSAIESFFDQIEKSILIAVFREWKRRLRLCIQIKGNYCGAFK